MTWLRYRFDGVLTHFVPKRLAPLLVLEMEGRGHPLTNTDYERRAGYPTEITDNPHQITGHAIDFGGMCHVNEPRETFPWGGSTMRIPSDQVDGALRALRALPLRRFDSRYYEPYYKLKYWMWALVMLPGQYHSLVAKLHAIAPAAKERSRVFWKLNAHPHEGMIPVQHPSGAIVMATPPFDVEGPVTS